jgi:hypothetical protein
MHCLAQRRQGAKRGGLGGKASASFVCGLAGFVLAASFATRNLATWPARIAYPGEESYEGTPLAEMVRLRQGDPIYASPSPEGFAAATYGPFYYLLGSRLINRGSPSYLPLRLLSVLGTLGCAAGCGLLAFWLTRSYLAAFLSPLVFLSYAMVTRYGVQAPPDGAALLLFFGGFLVAYRFRASRAVLLAAPLMLLGFYYKPQYVAGPMAVFLSLLIEKCYRRAVEFAGLLALGGLGLLAFFQWIVFPGQAFWRHFLLYQASLLSWRRFGQGVFILTAMLFLALLFAVDYLRRQPHTVISCYLLFGVLLGLLTYCKGGSGVHYFLECVLVTSTLVPALLAKRSTPGAVPVDVTLVLGLILAAGQLFGRRPPQPADAVRHSAMQLFLRRNFPPHARALGASAGDLVQAGLETPFSDLFQLVQMAKRGIVPDRDLVARIRARSFSVIVLSFDLGKERDPYWLDFYLTEPMRAAIERDYDLAASLEMPEPEKERAQDRFYVYVPRSSDRCAGEQRRWLVASGSWLVKGCRKTDFLPLSTNR